MTPDEGYHLLIADIDELAGLSRRTSEGLAAQFGQSVARWHVLSVVNSGPATVPFIAHRLGLARQSVQRVVHLLCDEHLILMQVNPDHARSPLFTITEDGSRVLSQIVQRSEAVGQRVLDSSGISGPELTQTQRTLRRMIDALRANASTRDPRTAG